MEVHGHRARVHGVRDPLRAGVLMLDDGETKAAIVTLDTIGRLGGHGEARAGERIEKETGVPAANILVAASHNHSGPGLAPRIGVGPRADQQARPRRRRRRRETCGPVSIGYGEDRIGFSINRRKIIDGRAVVRLNPDGPNDPRVKVLRFDDGNRSRRWP